MRPEDAVSDEEQKEGLRIMLGDRFIYLDSDEDREQLVSLASDDTTDDELEQNNGYLDTYLGSHHRRLRRSTSESSLNEAQYIQNLISGQTNEQISQRFGGNLRVDDRYLDAHREHDERLQIS
jgi:hypothetical protein